MNCQPNNFTCPECHSTQLRTVKEQRPVLHCTDCKAQGYADVWVKRSDLHSTLKTLLLRTVNQQVTHHATA